MQVAAAYRQHFIAALQMNVGSLVQAALDMADRAQVDDDRAVHLRKLRGVELGYQFL